MKTLKVLLQEVVSGIKAWVNSNFAQESNTVHKTGNETVNGVKTFSEGKIGLGSVNFAREFKGSTTYEMTASDFNNKLGFFKISQFKADSTSAPRGNNGDYDLIGMSSNTAYGTYLCTTPRNDLLWYGKFWESVWQGWKEVVNCESTQTITGEKTFSRTIKAKNYNYSRGTIPSTAQYSSLIFTDNSNNASARLLRWFNADGYNGFTMQCWDAQLTTEISERFQLQYDPSGNGQAILGGDNFKEFIPLTNNSIDLGTNTYKWKTFNGVNPGSLSFPSEGLTADKDYINIASAILPTGENATNFDNTKYNYYTPPVDGWLALSVKNCSYLSVWSPAMKTGQVAIAPDTTKNQQIMMPVVAGKQLEINIYGSSWHDARLIVPKGNIFS